MANAIAVLNAGSSSLKFSVFAERGDELELIARGQAEGLYTAPRFVAKDGAGKVLGEKSWGEGIELGHDGALDHLVTFLRAEFAEHRLAGVGHRVVHGGREYTQPVRMDAAILAALEKYVPLAPLHQPHNLAPIKAVLARSPDLPQVACFDTSFHSGAPPVAQAFALPKSITDRGVRRYGFHGLSYEYIASVLPQHDRARRARQDGGPASRQRRQHVRDGGRAQRRQHDGLHRRGRAADGHALRQPRSRRDPLPDRRAEDGRPRRREADLPAVRAARHVRHLQRHAHAGGERGAGSQGRDRRVRLPDRPRARARWPRRSAASTRSCSPAASARTAGRSARASAAMRRGSALRSTRRRTNRNGPRISAAGSRVSAWAIPTNEELMIARHTRRLLGER